MSAVLVSDVVKQQHHVTQSGRPTSNPQYSLFYYYSLICVPRTSYVITDDYLFV